MTKDELQAIGLNEEQIKEVFRLNGLAVNKVRDDFSDIEKELATLEATKENLESQIKTANEQINNFKHINVDELEGEITKYKDLYEDSQLEFQKEMEKVKLQQEIKLKVLESKPHNVDDVVSRLKIDNIKATENGILGLDEELERIKKDFPHYYPVVEDTGLVGTDPHDPIRDPIGNTNSSRSYDDFLNELK